MRARTTGVATLIVSAALGGCSAGSDGAADVRAPADTADPTAVLALPREEAIKRADAICRQAARRLRRVPSSADVDSGEGLREMGDAVLAVYVDTIELLYTITPPRPGRAAFDEFVASLSSFAEAYREELPLRVVALEETIDGPGFERFLRLVEQRKRYHDVGTGRARAFGLEDCQTSLGRDE